MIPSTQQSWLGRALNLFGVAVVAFYFIRVFSAGLPVWIIVVGSLALAAWFGLVFLPARPIWLPTLMLVVMVVAGALATAPSNGVLVVPVAVGVLRAVADPLRPLWRGVAITLAALAVIGVGVFISPLPTLAVLSIEGGVLIAFLGGISRRQFRTAETQGQAVREEQQRAATLAERQAVASDIHDVLAHSLGGLVIQLDAVEALLEAGRISDAASRVHDARALAVAGLAEARRAVGALRDPERSTADLPSAVDELARAHRSLGGVVLVESSGEPHPLSDAAGHALSRVLRESLTNARKHAPDAAVDVSIAWTPDGVELTVSNPLSPADGLASTGGGHGIPGMAERFARLPVAAFSAGEHDGRFVVDARVGES
jgi:signal transduction histidine kinase